MLNFNKSFLRVLSAGANFTNRLKLSHLSLCIDLSPKVDLSLFVKLACLCHITKTLHRSLVNLAACPKTPQILKVFLDSKVCFESLMYMSNSANYFTFDFKKWQSQEIHKKVNIWHLFDSYTSLHCPIDCYAKNVFNYRPLTWMVFKIRIHTSCIMYLVCRSDYHLMGHFLEYFRLQTPITYEFFMYF